MEMILLDWTRMGKSYCLAGVAVEDGRLRVVRPLLTRGRGAGVRNASWSAYLMDGHARWEVFELIDPAPAPPEPPHLEDVWVRAMRSCRRMAPAGQRRDILTSTTARPGEPKFGTPLSTTRASAYLTPGTGQRSLVTVVLPSGGIQFAATQRVGASEPELRVQLPVPALGDRRLPVKDHHLLQRAELTTSDPQGQANALQMMVHQMGEQVAVRLGLSRAYPPTPGSGSGFCWLMADGFFALADPQP